MERESLELGLYPAWVSGVGILILSLGGIAGNYCDSSCNKKVYIESKSGAAAGQKNGGADVKGASVKGNNSQTDSRTGRTEGEARD